MTNIQIGKLFNTFESVEYKKDISVIEVDKLINSYYNNIIINSEKEMYAINIKDFDHTVIAYVNPIKSKLFPTYFISFGSIGYAMTSPRCTYEFHNATIKYTLSKDVWEDLESSLKHTVERYTDAIIQLIPNDEVFEFFLLEKYKNVEV